MNNKANLLLLSFVLFLSGCWGDSLEDIEARTSSISIISVSPSSAVEGQQTLFSVVVEYKLSQGHSSTVVNIGFNDEYSNCYRIADQQVVSTGTGTLSFLNLASVPVDWGTAGNFSVAAILDSDYQLASAIQVISLTTGTN